MSAPTTDPMANSIPAAIRASPKEPTHACVRCGAPVAIDVGLCERCNPLGLRDSSASQVHGLAFIGVATAIILLAIVGRLALAGVGPFDASIAAVVPDEQGLTVTLSVANTGRSTGQTTCRITDPADRTGGIGAFMLSPGIEPGETVTFTQRVTELGSTARQLAVACSAP